MWTGIDIGSHSLKVIQLSRSWTGRFRIESASHFTFSSGSTSDRNNQIIQTLKQVFYSTGTKPKNCITGVSGREVNLRITLVPPLRESAKLRKMMEYEVEQIAGKSGGDVYSDFCRINLPAKPYPELPVLVGLAKNSYINEKIDLLQQAGVVLRDLCPDTIGLFTALRMCRKINLAETILLMDIGAENLNLIVQQGGNLILARNISGGGNLFTEAIKNRLNLSASQAELLKIRDGNLTAAHETKPDQINVALLSAVGQFHSVIQSSVSFSRAQLKKDDIEIDRVLISGGGGKVKGLTDHLTSVLNKPVEAFNPFDEIDLSGIDDKTRRKISETPSAMTVALGLAQCGINGSRETFISFLPPAIKKKKAFYQQTLVYATSITLILFTLILFTMATLKARNQVEKELGRLQKQQDQMNLTTNKFNAELKQKKGLLAEYNCFNRELKKRVFFTNTLMSVTQLFPEGAWLTKMVLGQFVTPPGTYETKYKDNVIVLEGYLEDNDHNTLKRFKDFVTDLNKTSDKINISLEKDLKLTKIGRVSRKGKISFEILIEEQD